GKSVRQKAHGKPPEGALKGTGAGRGPYSGHAVQSSTTAHRRWEFQEMPLPMFASITRRLALGFFAGATLLATGAGAQTFPERVIKMVVPYPAGGPTDVIARIVAEEMGKELG